MIPKRTEMVHYRFEIPPVFVADVVVSWKEGRSLVLSTVTARRKHIIGSLDGGLDMILF